MRGADDPLVTAGLLSGWAGLTDRAFEELTLPGGHFYRDGLADLLPVLAARLTAIGPAVSNLSAPDSLLTDGPSVGRSPRGDDGAPTKFTERVAR
ncbi:hypothetical protein ACFQ0T_20755 [Kitasatospora gansuensis]